MIPAEMRIWTDRLITTLSPFATAEIVGTGGNCTAVEVRPRGIPYGEHLLITNGDATAPLLDVDGVGRPDLEIMVGVHHDDYESESDSTVHHHNYDRNDATVAECADMAVAMTLRVVLSWLSARPMAEQLRTVATETLAVPVSVRYTTTLNGVGVHVDHPAVDSAMVVQPPTVWRASLFNGGDLVAESPDTADIVNAVREWLSV